MPKLLLELVRRLHRDERGAQGMEKLLIVAAIILPLLALLMVFRDRIYEWADNGWTVLRVRDAEPLTPTP